MIIGGTGGVGRSVATRMVQRGARHIVLLSRSAKITGELDQLIQDSRAVGAFIYVRPCDVADEAGVTTLIAELQKTLPPIRGLVHAAMVLKVRFVNQVVYSLPCTNVYLRLGCSVRKNVL